MKYTAEQAVMAVKQGKSEIISSLLNSMDSDEFFSIKDTNNFSLLQVAVISNQQNIVQLILEKKPGKLWVKTPNRETLLHLAALGGDSATFNYLLNLEKAAIADDEDIILMGDAVNLDGLTLLHAAVLGGNLEIVKSVYDHYPDYLNSLDSITQKTPLDYALTEAKKHWQRLFWYTRLLLAKGTWNI